MPRRHVDPVISVVDYFETASVDAAKTALEVARAIVQRRSGGVPKPTAVKKPGKKLPGPAPAVVGE